MARPRIERYPSGEKRTSRRRAHRTLPRRAVKVIEGAVMTAEGKVAFNAFGTISMTCEEAYTLHSYAMGYVGDFTVTPKADGYVWEIPMG